MKVWVVTYSGDESDGYVIEGVFSAQWRAQRFVEAQGMAVGDRYGIESWEIDEGVGRGGRRGTTRPIRGL